ncbi:dihydrofolate reductase family protein [Halalkalibacterium ligniniphilum]|uniref:dihydrofolate reductase family protein n=1 Tax=Halalkalibacterium ligniniphilum TaxID=1134413 RepID=UPI00034D9958|nr:dihydrofolate reductase family protein [Halalkalibacterium ligniniphilum]
MTRKEVNGQHSRRIIYSQMVSLDGFIEGSNGEIDWGVPDEELFKYINDQENTVDTHLYGRKTYKNMVEYWPTADENPAATEHEIRFARIWREIPKIVFSKTLEKVEWNARLVRDNITEEMAQLKSQPGKNLSLGGAHLASTFMKLNLIDEYQLYVHPILLGGGTPLFGATENTVRLELAEARTFSSGVVLLRYQKSQ